MRIGLALAWVAVAACGRSGFDASDRDGDTTGPPDYTTDPLDWPDFGRISTAVAITGINRPIELELRGNVGEGTAEIQFRLNGAGFTALAAGTPQIVTVQPDDTLQFRVGGTVGDSAFLTVANATLGNALVDTMVGTVSSLVTGTGTPASPYVAPPPLPQSCGDYAAGFFEQLGADGTYRIETGGAQLDVFCDMTTDGGGWTLVARVLGASTTHTTVNAVDTLTGPEQATTAKLADADINSMAFTHIRLAIAGVGTVYALRDVVSFGTTAFSVTNAAASSLAGPYTGQFYTATGCSADCGVSIMVQNLGFGGYCGYRYWSSGGNPRPGMGCQGNNGKNGTAWVR